MTYYFMNPKGKYRIPHLAIVELVKCYAKRKCVINYNGEQIITMVNQLRRTDKLKMGKDINAIKIVESDRRQGVFGKDYLD